MREGRLSREHSGLRSKEAWSFDWDEGSRGSSQLAGREWGEEWQNHEVRFGFVELVLEGV